MESPHVEKEVGTAVNSDGAISNNDVNTNVIINAEPNNNQVGKDGSNVIYAKQIFSNFFVDSERINIEPTNHSISENEDHVFLNEEYCICDEMLLTNMRIPINKCIDNISIAEKLVQDSFNDFKSGACTSNGEYLIPVINEQYITTDLTDFMKILSSDCENGHSNGTKCQSESLLQCLKCNEKFYHRFWAIRHFDFCKISDDEKFPNFKCEICEEKFKRVKDLRIHLQYCKKDSAKRLEEYTNLEEILEIVNYLSNTSEVLKENIRNFGHQQFYEHYCTNCIKSIIDEVSVNPVECNNCKAMCLLRCNACKCLHETNDSIIEHLKNSFCGYQMQFFGSSSFPLCEHKESNKLVTVQQQKDCDRRRQKKKPNKNAKIKATMLTLIVYCPQCTKSEVTQNVLAKCRNCNASLMYRCDKCNTEVSTLKALDLHNKSHLFKKYNLCPSCGKAFAQMKSLKMHEEICALSKTTEDDLIPKESVDSNIVLA